MKLLQYLAGVLLIALLVAGTLLTVGSWFTSMAAPAVQTEVETSAIPSDGIFTIDLPIAGSADLSYGASGELVDNLTAPSAAEKAGLPDLGKVDLAFLLHKGSGGAVTGYVDLETSLVFTGYHTININVLGKASTLTVGPKVSGTYKNGLLNLLSERVNYTTDGGQALQRQFRLAGTGSPSSGVLTGEYRETVWGYGATPLTVVGTFEMHDLKITSVHTDDNQAPIANALSLTTKPNKAVAAKLGGSDAEGSALTFAIVTQPLNGVLSGTAPNLTYTPKKDFEGIDSIIYKVNDGAKDSDNVAVTILVSADPNGNLAPVADAQTVNATQGKATAITLAGTDGNSDTLTFSVVTQPAHGSLSGTAPKLTYKSAGDFTGTDSFTFKVNDGKIDSPPATVKIVVKAGDPGDNPDDNGDTIYLPMTLNAGAGNAASQANTSPTITASPSITTTVVVNVGNTIYMPMTTK